MAGGLIAEGEAIKDFVADVGKNLSPDSGTKVAQNRPKSGTKVAQVGKVQGTTLGEC